MEKINAYGILAEKPDKDVGRWIVLKLILGETDRLGVWTGSIWLRIKESGGGLL
jgi:hypothetical protein